jgi:gluconokinase
LNHNLILAIDIGTSSVKAAFYNQMGRLVPGSLVKNENRLMKTADGGVEIDAAVAFRQLVEVIDAALAAAERIEGDVTHIAQCSFWHSLVGVDGGGKSTTKVLSWADNRSRNEVARLRRNFDVSEVHQRTGARFHSSYWPAKMLWIKRLDPDAFDRTDKWLSLSDYLALKLLGDSATSISMASATGLFDIRKCEWDKPLIRFLKLRNASLPIVVDQSHKLRLLKKYARRWPRLAKAEWFPAIGDGAANNIGSGCVAKTRAALMIGTSGALRVAYRGESPAKIPNGLWCYRIDRSRVVIGGALSDGGNLIEWMKDNLRMPPNFESLIAKRGPDSHGLIVLPFLAGERSTGYHENARGSVAGLTASTDAVSIAQAAMESVAYRFAEVFDRLRQVVKIEEIIASGGALKASSVWTQMIADVLGREITLVDTPEASLRGSVLLALETIGNIERIKQVLPGRGRVFRPNVERHAIYATARARHNRFYDLTFNDE